MKYKILSLLVLFALFSCNNKEEKTAKENKKEVPVKEKKIKVGKGWYQRKMEDPDAQIKMKILMKYLPENKYVNY